MIPRVRVRVRVRSTPLLKINKSPAGKSHLSVTQSSHTQEGCCTSQHPSADNNPAKIVERKLSAVTSQRFELTKRDILRAYWTSHPFKSENVETVKASHPATTEE